MNWKANYYGIRGRCGYVHDACLLDFQAAHARYDAQGRPVGMPEVDSLLDTLEPDAAAGKCLHCGKPLDPSAKSRNERLALELASDPVKLRKRLQEARILLTRTAAKLFGKGRFDFANRRLIGANGLALQWSTRHEPDQPESYRNQQTTAGCVTLVCPKDRPENSAG